MKKEKLRKDIETLFHSRVDWIEPHNTNVINSVLGLVSFCLVERNISVPTYCSISFQDVSSSLKIYNIYIITII